MRSALRALVALRLCAAVKMTDTGAPSLDMLAASHSSPPPPGEVEILHQWTALDFDWSALGTTREGALESGLFIPANCALTGIKAYDEQLYVTVPRWKPGVPSTMNRVVVNEEGESLLMPYPNAWMNNLSNPDGLRYTQSMEVDSQGRMWMIDVGRLNIFSEDPDDVVDGPAQLVIWDLATNAELDRFVLPENVAPAAGNFLNDIVVDEKRMTAYISDAQAASIVVVDMTNKRASVFKDESTLNEPSVEFTIDGVEYGNSTFTTPEDGIALTPAGDYVYYCALQALTLYRIPSKYLRAWPFDADAAARAREAVEVVGTKPSPADGMVFTNTSILYTGAIADPNNSVLSYALDPKEADDGASMKFDFVADAYWADTFAFDGKGSLLFTENHLSSWITGEMDVTGKDANFLIKSVFVGGYSYVDVKSASM